MMCHLQQKPRFFMFFICKYRSLFQIADERFLKDVLCIVPVSDLNIYCAVKQIAIFLYNVIDMFLLHKVILLFHLIHAPDVLKVTWILFFLSFPLHFSFWLFFYLFSVDFLFFLGYYMVIVFTGDFLILPGGIL